MKWRVEPARIEKMHEISDKIVSTCPEEIKMSVALVFEEVYVNITTYAYRNTTGKKKPLYIYWKKKKDFYYLRFIDKGEYFDPTLYKVKPSNEIQIGGHGIRLIKTLSKEVIYLRKGNKNYLEILF